MGLLFVFLGLAFATQIWLCFRVGRTSVPLAIATLLIGFPAALYTFFKNRGDDETSITVPFVANVVFTLLFFVMVWQVLLPALEAQEAEIERTLAGITGPQATARAPVAIEVPASAAIAASAASAAAPAASAPSADPVDAFSAALRSSGLAYTVTRLTTGMQLPPGVTDAALFSVQPMGGVASASAASAAAGSDLSATLFKCESASACRALAGLQMQQAGAEKRRVLQNGLLLLALPASITNDTDLTPAAVASAFRKL